MVIQELVTRFGFEIDDHGLKELEEGINAIKEGVLHLGELLIGEAVGLYELVERSAQSAVALKLAAEQSGIAADKLQELQFRAGLANVSADELNQSMNHLSRTMIQAKEGSEEARKHFRQLGITTAELRSGTLKTDDVLERVSKRFNAMPDGPQKTAMAWELFGRAGGRMVPVLNRLHEELSPINRELLEMSMITDEQIELSEAFHVNLNTLKLGLLGIVRVVGFGLIPVATEVIESMKKWIVQNRALIVTNLTGFVKGMTAALKLTVKIVDALIKSFSGFAGSIGGVETATKLLLGAFAILSGATILFGIGKVIEAVVALGNSFAVANLEAAAIPIAIGLAMVALGLILEDVFSFFTGKDSFLGDLLQALPGVGKAFQAVFEPIFEPFVKMITMITDGFTSWGDLFKTLGELFLNLVLAPLRSVVSLVAGAASLLGDSALGSGGLNAFSEGAQSFAGKITAGGIGDAASSIFGSGSSSPSASATGLGITPSAAVGGGSPTKQTNNEINLKQEFVFPPGTDPAVAGDKITPAVSSGLDDVLKQTQRAGYNGGTY